MKGNVKGKHVLSLLDRVDKGLLSSLNKLNISVLSL